MRFSIIIPAWNEEHTIQRAVYETQAALDTLGDPYEIIVVDDGSRDGTSMLVEQMTSQSLPVRVIRHAENRGKGAAIKTGVLAAMGEWMIFLDADLSVHPSEISRLVSAMDGTDIVIGSRRVLGATIPEPQPLMRDLAGRLFNIAVRLMTGLPYRDTQCGFKAYHRRTIPVFQELETSSWVFDVELLVRSRQRGFIIKEVPVTWRHGHESRVRWSDARDVFKTLRRMRLISSPSIISTKARRSRPRVPEA